MPKIDQQFSNGEQVSQENSAIPLIYLDHNVVDLCFKHPDLDLWSRLRASGQVVYSDESLAEIERCGPDYSPQYLAVPDRLGARHLRLEMVDFKPTGRAIVDIMTPQSAFAAFCENGKEYVDLLDSMNRLVHKSFGGRPEGHFSDIANLQVEAFRRITESALEGLVEDGLIDRATKQLLLSSAVSEMESKAQELADKLDQGAANQAGTSPIEDMRSFFKLGPKQFNNLKGPKIVEQIWAAYCSDPEFAASGITIEQFMGITFSEQAHGRQHFLDELAGIVYHWLNTVGYQQDSKMKRDDRFTAAKSDKAHVSMATFTGLFVSRDHALVQKAAAAYEFIGARTVAAHLQFSNRDEEGTESHAWCLDY